MFRRRIVQRRHLSFNTAIQLAAYNNHKHASLIQPLLQRRSSRRRSRRDLQNQSQCFPPSKSLSQPPASRPPLPPTPSTTSPSVSPYAPSPSPSATPTSPPSTPPSPRKLLAHHPCPYPRNPGSQTATRTRPSANNADRVSRHISALSTMPMMPVGALPLHGGLSLTSPTPQPAQPAQALGGPHQRQKQPSPNSTQQ